ncbi:MAG: DNA alkylation repair protein [Thermoleophilia bacterium]
MDAAGFTAAAQAAFRAAADPDRAPAMAAYMRGHFPFLGITRPARDALQRPLVRALEPAQAPAAALRLWLLPEREFQYLGADALRHHIGAQPAEVVRDLEVLITTKPWWDTVDTLAARCVGPLVAAHPALVAVMDDWIGAQDIWLARTAILHQLGYGPRTDPERLFAFCARRAADREFFIRKAIGWALRQYARTDPGAVRGFVEANRGTLSGLSVREATRHL